MEAKKATQSQRNIDVVNGYMKRAQLLLPYQDNPYYNIPELVNHICINFYNNSEYFTKYNENNVELNDDTTIYMKNDNFASCYGSLNIMVDTYSKYIWKFKMLEFQGLIAIGIDSSNKAHVDRDFYDCDNANPYYANEIYANGMGILYSHDASNSYSNRYAFTRIDTIGSLITMELNVKNRTLNYFINDIAQGNAFKNIYFDENTVYNMAVYGGGKNNTIQLTDFSHLFIE